MLSLKLAPAQLVKILDVVLVLLSEPDNAHLAKWVIIWQMMVTVIHALQVRLPQLLAKHLQVTVPLLVLTAPTVTLVWLLLEHVLHARLVVTSVVALA
jgi:hypothetical protein